MLCMLMKIFRIAHLGEINKTINRIRDMLGEFFYMYKHRIDIIVSWQLVFIHLIFIIHWFACGWLLLHNFKDHYNYRTVYFSAEDMTQEYVDSVYFMTTTISKVGYGDANFKGFIDGKSADWALEMGFLVFVIIFGSFIFAVMVNKVFNYHQLKTVHELVRKSKHETEVYLYEINSKVKDQMLPIDLIQESKDNMELQIRNSTLYHFAHNRFYQ